MYRHEIYLKKLQEELKRILLMDKSCLTISSLNNPFYPAANLMMGFGERLASELTHKKDKSILDYVYLITALKLTDQSYHPQLSEFKQAFPDNNSSETIDKLVNYLGKNQEIVEPKEAKDKIRRKYEMLIGKA